MKTIDIIIPAYNEEQRIGAMLRDYLAFYASQPEVHFTVVLNGCTDRTLDVVQKVTQQHPTQLSYMDIPEAIGKGGAIVRGWQASTAEIVGFVDADEATTPQEYQKVLDALTPDVDGAIASRFKPGSEILQRESRLRSFASQFFITLVKFLFQLPFYDIQCGAKVFRRAVLVDLLPRIREMNMIFDVELLYRLQQQGARIVEVPTVWIEQQGSAMLGSTSKFIRTAFTMLFSLFHLRFNK